MLSVESKNRRDFDWAFGLLRKHLRLIGVWPGGDEDHLELKASSVSLADLHVPFALLTMISFMLLPQIYALVLVINEMPLVIDNLMTSTAVLSGSIKMCFLWRSKKVLEPVMRSMKTDWLHSRSISADWELEVLTREAARVRMFNVCTYLVTAVFYIGLTLGPILGIEPRIITNITDYGGRYFPLQSYFPYDYSISPNYELTFLMQFVAGIFVCLASLSDNFFIALVLHACGQFEILGTHVEMSFSRLDTLPFSKNEDKTELSIYSSYRKKLQVFVDRHVHLMSNVAAIESAFKFILASQTLCMTGMVCCLGFEILSMVKGDTESKNKPTILQLIILVMIIFTVMLIMFIDCLASEMLATRSTRIFHSIYKSEWYVMDQHKARDIIFMMVAAKDPPLLTAGKILYLSLTTYTNILKTIIGYISVLLTVYAK